MNDQVILGKIAVSKKGKKLGEIIREYGDDDNALIVDKEHMIVLGETWFYNSCPIAIKTSRIIKIDAEKVWLNILKKEFHQLIKNHWAVVKLKGKEANTRRSGKDRIDQAIIWDKFTGP